MLIVIEGPDGSGKTMLVPKLKEKMERSNSDKKVSIYRFPSENFLGQAIRRHLKGELALAEMDKQIPADEDQLFFQCAMVTDRYVHALEIKDKLAAGETVILERWWQSGFAYGAAFGLDEEFLEKSQASLPQADVNILLDVEPDVARKRQPSGSDDEYEKKAWLRPKVRDNYLRLWTRRQHGGPGRWPILNANVTMEEVFMTAWGELVTTAQKSW